jgi:hypothetical protein
MAAPTTRAPRWRISAALALCLAVVPGSAVFTSTGVSENVPVPGGIAALARALDIDAPDRARCVAEVARIVYGDINHSRTDPASPYRRLLGHLAGATASGRDLTPVHAGRDLTPGRDLVPIPLTAALWGRAVFKRLLTSQTVFAAIVSDQDAALLAYGLAALDDETLEWFAAHPALLTTLYTRHAIAFGSFAAHLRVRGGRVVPPGGESAVPLWESVVGARVNEPVAFVTALFGSAKGRIAYLYDVIGHLDQPRAAFALGLWWPDGAVRLERFQALSRLSTSAMPEWNAARSPFARPAHDLLALFNRVQVERSGAPRWPASRRLWTDAMSWKADRSSGDGTTTGDGGLVDAAWLAEATLSGHALLRGEQLDQVAFGHRVFVSAKDASTADVVAAIGSLRRVPMLMLTLERIGIRRPAVYADMARHAQQVSRLDPGPQHRSLVQFQGAVALVARLVRVHTIDRAEAERLLDALASTPVDARRGYVGGVASWLRHRVYPMISAGADGTFEETLVQALAGPVRHDLTTPINWEGLSYVFDLQASEAARIRRFRQRRSALSLDATLEVYELAAKVANGVVGRGGFGDVLPGLRTALASLPDTAAIVRELTRPSTPAADLARVVLEAADALTADALLSYAYAIEWSDPWGQPRQEDELPRRHDFGLTAPGSARVRTAWAIPRLVFPRGEPWRVAGALLGLDVALAPLGLRKIDSAPPSGEPRLLSNNRHSFVISFGLLNSFALTDVDVDAIAQAVARGQRRVESLHAGPAQADGVIDEIAMDGWRARALRWNLVHAPETVPALFSLTELLHLGGGAELDVHAWGMSALDAFGCLCTVVPPPAIHRAVVGRDALGLLAVAVPDLNLRVAVVLRELNVPAGLAKAVLGVALHEYLRGVSPAHTDDWIALVRHARGLSHERIEDYLAAVAASDGPLLASQSTRRLP